jgi:hypothetical protein
VIREALPQPGGLRSEHADSIVVLSGKTLKLGPVTRDLVNARLAPNDNSQDPHVVIIECDAIIDTYLDWRARLAQAESDEVSQKRPWR